METNERYPYYVEVKPFTYFYMNKTPSPAHVHQIIKNPYQNEFVFPHDTGHTHSLNDPHHSHNYIPFMIADEIKEWFKDQGIVIADEIFFYLNDQAPPVGFDAVGCLYGVMFREASHAVAYKLRFG